MKIVVMGVSGSGKSTLGAAVARELNATFIDADDLHSAENIAHMASANPLTDEMRWPWLDDCAAAMLEHDRVVLACSALKRMYRDRLRATLPEIKLVYPRVTQDVVLMRMQSRDGHFMPTSLIDSQFQALEPPQTDENVVLIPSSMPISRAARLAAHVIRAGT